MSRESFYFTHDYNARTDFKIKNLTRIYGMEGYGIFWGIIEDLYNNANALPLNYDCIAFDLHTKPEIVERVINDFDLFVINDGHFGSTSVERRLQERNDKSELARKSAFSRWEKYKTDANAMRTQSDGNAIKERKGKEIKEKKENDNEDVIDYKSVIEFYHSLCPKMNKVVAINDVRKGYINARVGEYGMSKVIEVLRIAGECDFLNGINDRAWKADFEWIMRPTNFIKIMEGKYVVNEDNGHRVKGGYYED